jgi:hypothetical protein
MAFSHWTFTTSSAPAATMSVDTINTISGTASLRYLGTAAASFTAAIPTIASGIPHAIDKGALRCAVKPVAGTNKSFYLTCMQTNRNAVNAGCFCYSAEINDTDIKLKKHATGGITSAGTVLDTVPFTMSNGVIFTVEFQWITSLNQIGGIDFVIRTGTLLDYSDLTQVIHEIDPSTSAFTIGDGFGFRCGATGVEEFRVDQTELYRII